AEKTEMKRCKPPTDRKPCIIADNVTSPSDVLTGIVSFGPMPQGTNSKPWPEKSALMSFVNVLPRRIQSRNGFQATVSDGW
ncbi:hypothetical protein BS629_26135, partial [Rhizobium leguminosarum bv. viciae USDA 2370]|uniref:hypothetical protein n=1 Tax=Rhizobium leguminosarum TaxID=384 RepID=UPI0009CC2B3A